MIRSLQSGYQTARYSQQLGLRPGDRIKEPIFQTGLSKHHSIYLGIDQYGQELIAENHKFEGVRILKADEFFKEGQNYTIESLEGTYLDRIAAVKRALTLLGKPYDLVSYNCEHYASYVQSGKPESKQVLNSIGGIAFAFLLALLFSEE